MIAVIAAPSINASTINIFLINIFQSTNDIIQIKGNKTSICNNCFLFMIYPFCLTIISCHAN